MSTVIRPSSNGDYQTERHNCPVCGSKFVGEHFIADPGIEIRECANRHSWEKHYNNAVGQIEHGPPAFDNVYRPLYDTKEPVKRLFDR